MNPHISPAAWTLFEEDAATVGDSQRQSATTLCVRVCVCVESASRTDR